MLTLLYHNVLAAPAEHLPVAGGQVSLETFAAHLRRFRNELIHPLEAHEQILRGKEPKGVLVTFDDGAAGIIDAGRVLADFGAVGVAFVCPGAVESGLWFYALADLLSRATVLNCRYQGFDLRLTSTPDLHSAYRVLSKPLFDLKPAVRDEIMAGLFEVLQPAGETATPLRTLDEVGLRQAAETRGLIFANHSWSHPSLVKLGTPELEHEVEEAQDWLDGSGLPVVPWFAFPLGEHDAGVRDVVARVCPVAFGASAREPEPGVLPRTYLCEADANWMRFAAKTTCKGRLRRHLLWK